MTPRHTDEEIIGTKLPVQTRHAGHVATIVGRSDVYPGAFVIRCECGAETMTGEVWIDDTIDAGTIDTYAFTNADADADRAARAVGEIVGNTIDAAFARSALMPGARVECKHDVDRYPHFTVPAGAKGTVTTDGNPDVVTVKLDDHIAGAEDWDNEIVWSIRDGDNPLEDVAVIQGGA